MVPVEALAPAVVAVVVEVVAAVPVPVEPGWEEAGVVRVSAPERQGLQFISLDSDKRPALQRKQESRG